MTFERILKDFKASYLAKTQDLPNAFAQVPTISQLYLTYGELEVFLHPTLAQKHCSEGQIVEPREMLTQK